jgi:hypothetical protein
VFEPLDRRLDRLVAPNVRATYTIVVMLSAADRERRLGIWKIHILHH